MHLNYMQQKGMLTWLGLNHYDNVLTSLIFWAELHLYFSENYKFTLLTWEINNTQIVIANLCGLKAVLCRCLESLTFQVSLQLDNHISWTQNTLLSFSLLHIQKENMISNQINIPKQKGYCPIFSDHCSQVAQEGYANKDVFNNHHNHNFLHFL